MKIDLSELKKLYEQMPQEQFVTLKREDLTPEAQVVYDREVQRRSTPEWLARQASLEAEFEAQRLAEERQRLADESLATEIGGIWPGAGRRKWKVDITPEKVDFASVDGNEHISIRKSGRLIPIELVASIRSFENVRVDYRGKEYRFWLGRDDFAALRDWLPPKTVTEIRHALVPTGVGLILVGIAHFVFARHLEPVWGLVLVALGVLNLVKSSSPSMFAVNGVLLIIAGVSNFRAVTMLGVLQVGWGIEEIYRYTLNTRSRPHVDQAADASPFPFQPKDSDVDPGHAGSFCYHCGADLSEDANRCSSCGKEL